MVLQPETTVSGVFFVTSLILFRLVFKSLHYHVPNIQTKMIKHIVLENDCMTFQVTWNSLNKFIVNLNNSFTRWDNSRLKFPTWQSTWINVYQVSKHE